MKQEKTLLVEGEDDRKFFTTLFKHELGFTEDDFSIDPPKAAENIHRNGFNTLLKILPSRLDLVRAQKIKRLGVVVDADSGDFGFNKRREDITKLLAEYGYEIPQEAMLHRGEVFLHPEFSPVGLWIMPDHGNDGIFEDNLLQSITEEKQSELKGIALGAIQKLGERQLFNPKQFPKAHLATWLAWQAYPGSTAAYAYYQNLFDKQVPGLAALINWLKQVFADEQA